MLRTSERVAALARAYSGSTRVAKAPQTSVLIAPQEDLRPLEQVEQQHGIKPYHSIPGPKALPLLGNSWRFLPFVGENCGILFSSFILCTL